MNRLHRRLHRRLRYRLVAAALAVAAPVTAQGSSASTSQPSRAAPVDAALEPSVRALRAALMEMARSDRDLLPTEGASSLRAADDAALERRAIARARIAAGLDTLLEAGVTGRAAIRSLAADWPGADQVQRAVVRAAFRAGDARDALAEVERLAPVVPRDTQLLRWRAQALDTLDRRPEALRARQARFELAPEDRAAWPALLAAHEAAGSLPRLRESLGRMRLLYPESEAVREHEIEVLHRLGRREEAARLSADTTGRRP
ncbi:MAG: tetratricopeptide repeat protein [Gemmatimonadaceae bacterium]